MLHFLALFVAGLRMIFDYLFGDLRFLDMNTAPSVIAFYELPKLNPGENKYLMRTKDA